MKKIIILCMFFLALSAVAYCGQESRIELADGSVINGEIVSFTDGVYVINSAVFGEIKIEASKVSKIGPANLNQSQIDAYKEKLMGNPESAALITGLASNPQIQEIVKDPQIQDALKSGDIQALMQNEKFMDIVNDPDINEAIKKLKQ